MASLQAWVDWADRRLEAVVKREKIRVGVAGYVRGPLTVTFKTRLLSPNRAELNRLLALGPVFSQAVQAAVRVVDTPEGVLIEVAAPDLARQTPPVEALVAVSKGMKPVIGFDSFKRPVALDFDRWPHLLCLGPTRRGKSTAIRSLLFTLAATNSPSRFAFLVIAKKSGNWSGFAQVAHCVGVVVDPVEVEAAVAWVADVLQRRAADRVASPHFFLVVDDLANVVSRAKVADRLAEVATLGGEVGLHVIASTQVDGREGGLSQSLAGNFTARLVFGAVDASAGARFAGRRGVGVEAVGVCPGDCLLLLDGQPTRVATAHLDDRLLSTLPSGVTPSPWLKTVAAGRQNAQNAPEREERPVPVPQVAGDASDLTGGNGEERGRNARSKNAPLLDPNHPPSAEDRRLLRRLFADLGSKERVYKAAWGFKNGRVYTWLTEALAESDDVEVVDLTTEEGRRYFAALQSEGLIQ